MPFFFVTIYYALTTYLFANKVVLGRTLIIIFLAITAIIFLVAIAATGLVSWAGLQGGIIRHTEVRGDIPFLVPAKTESESGGHSESTDSDHSH